MAVCSWNPVRCAPRRPPERSVRAGPLNWSRFVVRWVAAAGHQNGLLVACLCVSFALFSALSDIKSAFQASVRQEGMDNLLVINRDSFISGLPLKYAAALQRVRGVEEVTYASWFGGVVGAKPDAVSAYAVDAGTYLSVNSDMRIVQGSAADWRNDRTSAVVGRDLMRAFHWHLGERIALQSNIWRRSDGSSAWPVRIAAVYELSDSRAKSNKLLMHYGYFDGLNAMSLEKSSQVGFFLIRPGRSADLMHLAEQIDARLATQVPATRTSSVNAYMRSFLEKSINVSLLVNAVSGIVFLTICIVTVSLVWQAAIRRGPHWWTMRALGFEERTIIAVLFAEAVVVVIIGCAAGLALGAWAIHSLASKLADVLPDLTFRADSALTALLFAVLLACVATIAPALFVRTLRRRRVLVQ